MGEKHSMKQEALSRTKSREEIKNEKPFQCEFCSRKFSKEKSLINHVCEKKRRWLNKNEKHVQLGFYAYQRFYSLMNKNGKKTKTFQDFIDSRYYTAFVRFARNLLDLNPIDVERYIDFVIKKEIKIDDWTKDWVYEVYIREYYKLESMEKALERSFNTMHQWSKEQGKDWRDFFQKVNTQKVVYLMSHGHLSPWVMYCSDKSKDLFDRMTEEQLQILEKYIDVKYWKQVYVNQKDEIEYVRSILQECGL